VRADEVTAEAVEQTGLDDFGGDSFREGLGVLCEAVDAEARLSDFGAIAVRANIVGSLANRLRIVDYVAADPAVADEPIEAPLFVVGMFRAGTTLLSHLFDQDPDNRALLSWEVADSVPPPTPENFRSGPRVEAVRAGQQMLSQINPAIDTVHHEQADQSTECLAILGQEFKSLLWEAVANVPTYGSWLDGADHLSAYRHHRRVLQVLQHGGVRGRWTLKSPHHAIALDALTTVYPDARLVLLHRDPVMLCASVCSLISTLSGTFTDADHTAYIAERWPHVLDLCVERIEAFRSTHADHPIVDVQYLDLVREPATTVARIYDAVGWPADPVAMRAMDAFVADNPKGRFGAHRYDLADFGLDAGQIRERFAGYIERYGVELEAEGRL
jgi:sulfotransferase family protein